jgi:inosine/xanthosine triphosphate pyrophosphatase family protein/very-short-patch-repair endonuclease
MNAPAFDRRLVIGTHNQKKGAELAELLAPWGFTVATLAEFPAAIDVVESGDTFAANALLKATQQARHLGRWVLADDSGLEVDALGGAPGVYSARFAARSSPGPGEGPGEDPLVHTPTRLCTRNKPLLDPEFRDFARQLREQQTDAESLLWSLLRDRRLGGFKFRRQHPVAPYVLDFYCHDVKLAIELDGGQHNTEEEKQHDAHRSEFLANQGIRVVRYWNHEVMHETESVLESILIASSGVEAVGALGTRIEMQRPSPGPSPGPGEGARSSPGPGEGPGEDIFPDDANNRKLLELLGNMSLQNRTARYVCHVTVADPTGTVRAESHDFCSGRVRFEPAGTNGFGYDPLFEVVEYHRTFGELGPHVKQAISHRSRALRAILPKLLSLTQE